MSRALLNNKNHVPESIFRELIELGVEEETEAVVVVGRMIMMVMAVTW